MGAKFVAPSIICASQKKEQPPFPKAACHFQFNGKFFLHAHVRGRVAPIGVVGAAAEDLDLPDLGLNRRISSNHAIFDEIECF